MKDRILNIERGLTKIILTICVLAIIVGTGMVFTITIARYFFGISWEWAEELSRYCIIFAALLGSGPMVFKETHICMSIISEKIQSRKLLLMHQLLTAVCVLIITILLFIWGVELVLASNMRSYSLIFTMKAIYAMIPISMAVSILYCVLKILAVLFSINETPKGGEMKL